LAGSCKALEVTTTVHFGKKGKGYFKWAGADVVFFCSSRVKKRQAHTNGEREGRAAETENTAAVVVLTLPLHLIVKERAQRMLLSFPLR